MSDVIVSMPASTADRRAAKQTILAAYRRLVDETPADDFQTIHSADLRRRQGALYEIYISEAPDVLDIDDESLLTTQNWMRAANLMASAGWQTAALRRAAAVLSWGDHENMLWNHPSERACRALGRPHFIPSGPRP